MSEDKNNAEILSCLQMDVSQVGSVTDRYTVISASYVFRIVSGLAGRREEAMDQLIESSREKPELDGDAGEISGRPPRLEF